MIKVIVIVCITILIPLSAVFGDTISSKHALVVAIGDYPPESGFRHIFAANDLKIILKLLQQQGFSDTLVLRDRQATREGFLNAFSTLMSRVHQGDIVYIHFSSHGQQLQDIGNDEADGFDEALALYDSRTTCSDDYKGQNHLTDDEFGDLIETLRKKLGRDGDVFVMVDACHSGTITRGVDTLRIRGGYTPLIYINEDQKYRGIKTTDDKAGMFNISNSGTDVNKAGYTIISACRNNEVSTEYYYDHNYYGPLTWAFLNAYLNSTVENYTYSQLFYDIRSIMTSMFENSSARQNPTFESVGAAGSERVIFGGKKLVQQPYELIRSFINPMTVTISGGRLNGITYNSAVRIYPAGTRDPSASGTLVAKGKVIQPGYLESRVALDNPVESISPEKYWVFVEQNEFDIVKYITDINASSPDINLTVEFLNNDLSRSDKYIFHEKKDTAVLQIINTGKSSIYFNIIETDPLKNINVFLPDHEKPVSECYLQPGQKFRIKNTFSRPYGTGTLKVIASERRFDLSHLIGKDNRLPDENFSEFIVNRETDDSHPDEIATFNITFEIIK